MKLNLKVLLPIGIIAGGGIAAAGLIAARSDVQTRPPDTPAPLIRTIKVQPESIQLKVLAQGTVAARTESDLIAQVNGEVIEVAPAFAMGGFFRRGDTLARIDPRDYELALTTARVQVAQARLQLVREQEESRIAREEWDRTGEGQPTSLVLREPQLDQAEAALEAVVVDEGLLHGMQGALQRQALDGGDLGVVEGHGEGHAGIHPPPVHDHRAGAALAAVAALLGSGQVQPLET